MMMGTQISSVRSFPIHTDLDYSPVIIDKMRTRVPELEWRVMDIRELKQHSDELGGANSWDVIIDKGKYSATNARHNGRTHGRKRVCVES